MRESDAETEPIQVANYEKYLAVKAVRQGRCFSLPHTLSSCCSSFTQATSISRLLTSKRTSHTLETPWSLPCPQAGWKRFVPENKESEEQLLPKSYRHTHTHTSHVLFYLILTWDIIYSKYFYKWGYLFYLLSIYGFLFPKFCHLVCCNKIYLSIYLCSVFLLICFLLAGSCICQNESDQRFSRLNCEVSDSQFSCFA